MTITAADLKLDRIGGGCIRIRKTPFTIKVVGRLNEPGGIKHEVHDDRKWDSYCSTHDSKKEALEAAFRLLTSK